MQSFIFGLILKKFTLFSINVISLIVNSYGSLLVIVLYIMIIIDHREY